MPGEPTFLKGNRSTRGAPVLVMDGMHYYARETFTYPSVSSAQVHTVTVWANGYASCTCRGWTVKRAGRARGCKHTARHTGAHVAQYIEREQPFVEPHGYDTAARQLAEYERGRREAQALREAQDTDAEYQRGRRAAQVEADRAHVRAWVKPEPVKPALKRRIYLDG